MPELLVDFITSLDGYGAADGWPGWWGLQGPEYLAWLGDQPEADHTVLMGANTYRLMSGRCVRQLVVGGEDVTADGLGERNVETVGVGDVVAQSRRTSPLGAARRRSDHPGSKPPRPAGQPT